MSSFSLSPLQNTLPDHFYSLAFKNSSPRHAYSLLIGRLKDAKASNDHLADYFRDRLVIEDQYTKALLKLSKRPSSPALNLNNNNSSQLLGSFNQLLHHELLAIIDRHEAYQLKLHADVEQSIRNCSILGSANWPSIKAIDDSLNALVKSYEDCDQRAQKSRSKLAATSNPKKIPPLQARLSEDEQMLEHANLSWLQKAIDSFNSLQQLDHQRLLNLVESLAKFETIQADHARDQIDIAERSMAALLSFDAQEDIQRFALAHGQLPDPIPNSIPNSTSTSNPALRPTPAPSHRGHQVLEITSPPAPLSDSPPQLPSTDIHLPRPSTSLPRSPPQASLANYDPNHVDIPRLNTPNISVPQRPPPTNSNQLPLEAILPSRALYVQRQSSLRSVKNLYRNGSSNDLTRSQPLPSPHQASSKPPSGGGSSIAEKLFSKSRLTNMLVRTSPSSAGHGSLGGGGALRRGSQTGERPSGEALSRPARSASLLGSGRVASQDLYTMDAPATRPASRISQFLPSAIHPGSRRKNSGSHGAALPIGKLDPEGYSIPPEDRGRKPWEIDTDGAGDRTEVLSGSEEEARAKGSTSRSGTDDWAQGGSASAGLGGFAIGPPPAQMAGVESESERQAAIAKVQNTLSEGGGVRRANTGLRGRRADGRGVTVYENKALAGSVSLSEDGYGRAHVPGSAGSRTTTTMSGMQVEQQDGSGTNSVRSPIGSPLGIVEFGHGLGGTDGGKKVNRGATMELRVRERLDVLMEGGVVLKVMVLGEVDVRMSGSVSRDGSCGLAIRLGGYEGLEKVVPAPLLVEAKGGGVYKLLVGQQKEEEEKCVLKYRVLMDGRQGLAERHVPLTVRPLWRTSDGKTEVAVGYSRNMGWTQQTGQKVVLEQVKLETVVYSPEAGMVPGHKEKKKIVDWQSVPNGKFDEQMNRLEWDVGEVKINNGKDQKEEQEGGNGKVEKEKEKEQEGLLLGSGRVLGRFLHDGIGDLESCGPVGVRFKVSGISVSGIEVDVIDESCITGAGVVGGGGVGEEEEKTIKDQRNCISSSRRSSCLNEGVIGGLNQLGGNDDDDGCFKVVGRWKVFVDRVVETGTFWAR